MITFSQIMDMMSGDEVFRLLSHPQEVGTGKLFCLAAWTCPKIVVGEKLTDIMVQSGAMPSLSEARRKIKEGGVRWNGVKVTDLEMRVEFFKFGWGVIQVGKKNHTMVINNAELCVERT